MTNLTLISGPSGSGKSAWAEHLACSQHRQVVYVATGPDRPDDAAWQQRLARHRRRRPPAWWIWEVRGQLGAALARLEPGQLALVDSLGTWVAAHLDRDAEAWETEQQEVLHQLTHCLAELLLVSEEVSWGLVPPTAVGGLFRDRLSELNRRLALRCRQQWLVVQGRALDLTALARPVPDLG